MTIPVRRCVDAEATQRAGEQLAPLLQCGDVVLLEGPLGAGKTTFTQGVARGLGVVERVTSPTFTLVRQHRCLGHRTIATLHHADIYRVTTLGEVVDLGLGELVEESAVAVIEWGELAASIFGPHVLQIRLDVDSDDARTLTLSGDVVSGRAVALDEWSRS